MPTEYPESSQQNRASHGDASETEVNQVDQQRSTTTENQSPSGYDRRQFLSHSAQGVAAGSLVVAANRAAAGRSSGESPVANASSAASAPLTVEDFSTPDSLCHPLAWETLNPGYWQIKNKALRRRLTNVGDRARATGFPFHSATRGGKMKTEYDPSLPTGIIYHRDWYVTGSYTIKATLTYHAERPAVRKGDDANWRMYQDGNGLMGIALGAKSIFESYTKIRHAIVVAWHDDQTLRITQPTRRNRRQANRRSPVEKVKLSQPLKPGEQVQLLVRVVPVANNQVRVIAAIKRADGQGETVTTETRVSRYAAQGFVGIAGRGLMDFDVPQIELADAKLERPAAAPVDCYSCYPLGDTLKKQGHDWYVRFIGLFASDGKQAEIRVSQEANPAGGWAQVPVAGSAKIVNHKWRRNTAVIDTKLPLSPAESTLYYTVWKDGKNVTADTRIGSGATGPGTGLVGDVPAQGDYVGRLPQLKAPYKFCGLSCHALTSGLQEQTEQGWKILGGGDRWQFRDQPTQAAFKHLEEYDFQVMVWEDDVWYMELMFYPPSTDDAYRVVTNSICGPTSRWQMMRHWNIINPGDHDYGMDDVKGPEQIAIRKLTGLGQDPTYMRRNFQIVHHLITGAERVDPLANPKKWRAWKMPNRDMTLVILDSRLWRSSQDVDIWDDAGWDHFKSIYDRTDPTRSLLGEEQFAWLQSTLTTDSSPLMCVTGINGMHTIWAGGKGPDPSDQHPMKFSQRDRVTADYAGWVKAGADRVLELFGGRQGIVTVYGDVHNGCVMKNQQHRVWECSFGPIGRSGGRALIPGFGPEMKDVDGRPVEIHSLYHNQFASPQLAKHAKQDPFYWNFLEIELDPRGSDPKITLQVRNMIDPPAATPRGGGSGTTTASQTGRDSGSHVRGMKTLANADVRFTLVNGKPLRATRSHADGTVPPVRLIDIPANTTVVVTAYDGKQVKSKLVTTA